MFNANFRSIRMPSATVAGTLRCAVCEEFAVQRIESSKRHMECAYHHGQPLDEPTGIVYGQVH